MSMLQKKMRTELEDPFFVYYPSTPPPVQHLHTFQALGLGLIVILLSVRNFTLSLFGANRILIMRVK